jgi:hypothetical protein
MFSWDCVHVQNNLDYVLLSRALERSLLDTVDIDLPGSETDYPAVE